MAEKHPGGRPSGSMKSALRHVVEKLGGIVGDESLPVEQRLAAADTVARIAQLPTVERAA